MQSKHALQSTSSWGAIVLVIPIVMMFFGAPLTEDQLAQVKSAGVALDSIMMQLMILVGAAQMIVGRLNARQPLHFIPGNTFVLKPDGTKEYLNPKLLKPVKTIPPDVAKAINDLASGEPAHKDPA